LLNSTQCMCVEGNWFMGLFQGVSEWHKDNLLAVPIGVQAGPKIMG